MKLLFCSDLHGNEFLYQTLLDYSIKNQIKNILIGGDICPNVRGDLNLGINCQKEFIHDFLFYFFKKLKNNGIELFIMMGNDDFKVNYDLLEKAENNGLIKLLHNKLNKMDNWPIMGYSFVPQMPFLLKDWEKLDNKDSKPLTDPKKDIRTVEKEEGTIEQDLKNLEKLSDPKKTIYSIHSPPFNTGLDITYENEHVGSKSVKKFIETEQPLLTLHGHIHESHIISGVWKEKIGKTICINPGKNKISSVLNLVVIDLEDLDNIKFFEV